ncbi:hypothetical protein [Streptomyces sp. NPDC058701]|uniref:AMIN-like domain-containing (lipo)protein n=1 Tax=Streptomyces sp. NPDC058701 TaxID=3346608 RepID=UPI00365FCF97
MKLSLRHLIRGSAVSAAVLAVGLTATVATPAIAAPFTMARFLDVRAAAHPDHDRLVFDLTNGTLPTVRATVVPDGMYTGPRGEPEHFKIAGVSYLVLDVGPAAAHDDAGAVTYTNPPVQPLTLDGIKGVQLLSDFEGHVEFGVSLGSGSRYRTFTLADPNRLVVDVYRSPEATPSWPWPGVVQ